MTIEELIPSILGPLVDGRHYWDTTPPTGPVKDANGVYLPYYISQTVGGSDETYIDQSFPDYEHTRLQVIAFAPTSLVAKQYIRLARNAILAAHKPADIIGSPIAIYDPALLLRGRLQHFSIWIRP